MERSKSFLNWRQHVIMQKHAEIQVFDATVHLPRNSGRRSCSFYPTRQPSLWAIPRRMSLPPQKRLTPKRLNKERGRKATVWQGFELNLEWVSVVRKWMKCTRTIGRMGNSQEENKSIREDPVNQKVYLTEAALSEQPFSLWAKPERILQGLWRTVGWESNCQSLWNNAVVNLPSDAMVRKGMTLLRERDVGKAICTEKGHWWGVASTHAKASVKVSAPTVGPSWSSARGGIWGKKRTGVLKTGRASFRLISERLSSPLELIAWQSEKFVSSPCKAILWLNLISRNDKYLYAGEKGKKLPEGIFRLATLRI